MSGLTSIQSPKPRPSFTLRHAAVSCLAAASMLAFTGCLSDKDDEEGYDVPTAYSEFENVDFSGQTARLDMTAEIIGLIRAAHEPGVEVDAEKLKAMFANEGEPFSAASLNTSGKRLSDKTFAPDLDSYADLFEAAEAASQSEEPAENGKAGRVQNASGRYYLVDENGVEFKEGFEKGLMGACFMYQALAVYLDPDGKLAEDLDVATQTHHWDEAYGYYTSSVHFPDSGLRYWSNYGNGRDSLLNINDRILAGFLKGRAAALHEDRETMLEAIEEVRAAWEDVAAGTAVHYLNGAKKNITDDGARIHQLSEARGLIRALKFNPSKRITDAQIEAALGHVGENFWEVTLDGLDEAIDLLSEIYGYDAFKGQL